MSTTVIVLLGPVEDFLSVLTRVLWSVGAPELCHAHLASSFLTGSLSAETIVVHPVSLRDGIFLRGLSSWMTGTVRVRQLPGSLMAPLTRWVEGDGNVLGSRCRRTSYCCVSLVTVHVGPT